MEPAKFMVGVDVGGTFTDIMFFGSDGRVFVKKVSTTPPDYSRGIAGGVNKVLEENKIAGSSIERLTHGTTVVTNAIVEKTGAKTGLITTRGFRDILEIGRSRLPVLYDLFWVKPTPLITRQLRVEVDERIGADGEIVRPLDTDSVIAAIDKLVSHGVESVGVCLINSPHNPSHEKKIGQILRERAPHLLVSLSTDVMCMLKEAERSSEVTVNAYVMPLVTNYMKSLTNALANIGMNSPIYIMQSSGGMTTTEGSMEKPIEIIEAGPAAGVVGVHYLASELGMKNAITFDMGGTTTKAAIIEDGQFSRSIEYEVGAQIHRPSRLLKGSGYILRVPAIDVAEVGSGGGSILWLDSGGLLNVGPKSAGAVPGPVCYEQGGEEPTLTDAYVAMGYLNPDYLLGGEFEINSSRSFQAVEEKIARPLNRGVYEAAYGAYELANSNMTRAITAVSSERGRDPRQFSLIAFGGAGAIHAAAIAKSLEMKGVIVAPYAGIFSACGLLFADIERRYVRAFRHILNESGIREANSVLQAMSEDALASAEKWGYPGADVKIERYADLRYIAQTTELTIPVPDGKTGKPAASLRQIFEEEHRKTYDYTLPESELEIINLRIAARIPALKPAFPERAGNAGKTSRRDTPRRKAYFGKGYGLADTPVLSPEQLRKSTQPGPLIVESYDTTIIVPPECRASAGPSGTVTIRF